MDTLLEVTGTFFSCYTFLFKFCCNTLEFESKTYEYVEKNESEILLFNIMSLVLIM